MATKRDREVTEALLHGEGNAAAESVKGEKAEPATANRLHSLSLPEEEEEED